MANINICILALMSMQLVTGAKILAIFPSDVKSHFTLGTVVLRELASRGHEVSPYSGKLNFEVE